MKKILIYFLPILLNTEILNYKKLNEKLELTPEASSESNSKNPEIPNKTKPISIPNQDLKKILSTQSELVKNSKTPKSFSFQLPYTKKLLVTNPYSDDSENPHYGIVFKPIDFGSVVASMTGKVVALDYMDGYHNYIILEHPEGFYTVYGNLEQTVVGEGQIVKKGETLGALLKEKGLYFQISQGKKTLDPNLLVKN
jgi:lipoprotein YgeR